MRSGGVTYTQLPGGRADAAGHHWLSVHTFTSAGQAAGAAPVGGQDPLAALSLVSDPKDVQVVGHERVRGVKTDHYRVQLDPRRLGDTLAKGNLNIAVPAGALDSLTDAVIDLWVDGSKLPRRMTMSFSIQGVKAAMTFEYLDYGKPVDITVPPAADVTDVGSPQELGARLGALITR